MAPQNIEAWRNFSKTVFQAMRKGASKEEIMEAIWVASEMRAGAAYAHASIAMEEMEKIDRNIIAARQWKQVTYAFGHWLFLVLALWPLRVFHKLIIVEKKGISQGSTPVIYPLVIS